MGKELEYKLRISRQEILAQITQDPRITVLLEGSWEETEMATEYYDSADARFSKRHWTIRLRQEGTQSVVCVKTPSPEAHTRGEWQIYAGEISEEAIIRLLEIGAPKELLYHYGAGDISPVCGARFCRKHAMLRFSDGSAAELACDTGLLTGKTQQMPLCELELELYEGDPAEMLELVHYLCQTYDLAEETKSKHARARTLK